MIILIDPQSSFLFTRDRLEREAREVVSRDGEVLLAQDIHPETDPGDLWPLHSPVLPK